MIDSKISRHRGTREMQKCLYFRVYSTRDFIGAIVWRNIEQSQPIENMQKGGDIYIPIERVLLIRAT